jgi:hypothetical protein
MSIGSRIAGANESGGGNYVTAGDHTFKVRQLLEKDGRKGQMFIGELITMASTTEAPGTIKSYVELFTLEGADGRCKSFCLAVLRAMCLAVGEDIPDFSKLSDADLGVEIDALVSADNPGQETIIYCQAWAAKSKKGGDVTNKRWSHEPFA